MTNEPAEESEATEQIPLAQAAINSSLSSNTVPLVGPSTVDDDANEHLVALSPPESSEEIGRLGGYRVLSLLGKGGMGLVYEAVDDRLSRRVALKVMRPRIAKRADARDRFLREARLAAGVEHPNVIAIYQVDEDHGIPFLAMPLLKGESLERRLRHGSPLTPPFALEIGKQMAAGLAAAHKSGLIHRDIKPANVWLEPGDSDLVPRVRILDFGLARNSDSDVSLTQSGIIIGTPAYMAPEQARNVPFDHRADLFSLGVTLYEMTTGKMPFTGTDVMSVLTSLAVDHPTPPSQATSSVPKAVSDLIMQMLEKNPAARPQSASEVAVRLQRMLAPTVELLPSDERSASADPWNNIDSTAETPALKSSALREAPKNGNRLWLGIGIGTLAVAVLFGIIFAMTRDTTKKNGTTADASGAPSDVPRKNANAGKPPRRKTPPRVGVQDSQFALRFLPGQKVEVPDLELPANRPLTLEAYVTPDNVNNDPEGHVMGVKFQLRVVLGGDLGRGSEWGLHANVEKGNGSTSAKGVTARRTHIAAVRTLKEHRLYVDGKLVARIDVSGQLPVTGTPFMIGGDAFRGLIDMVRVSSVARYNADFTPPTTYTLDDDTVLLLPFDEGEGDELEDLTDNDYEGFIHGAKWVNKDGTPIKP